MSEVRFNVGDRELRLIDNDMGKESVIYDGRTVSEKYSFWKSTHQFQVEEGGEDVGYKVNFKNSLSGVKSYIVKRKISTVKTGVIPSVTVGLLKIFFFFLGLIFVTQTIGLILFADTFLSMYSGGIITLYLSFGENIIFAILFLTFAFFLKRILREKPKFVSIVLWIRIGMMIVTLPVVFLSGNPMAIAFRIGFIWLLWFLLENCKAVAGELKTEP